MKLIINYTDGSSKEIRGNTNLRPLKNRFNVENGDVEIYVPYKKLASMTLSGFGDLYK